MNYLKFISYGATIFEIVNNDNIALGRIERIRVGRWMSWVLFLNPDCYLSASCQDEVREQTKKCNAREKVSKQKSWDNETKGDLDGFRNDIYM